MFSISGHEELGSSSEGAFEDAIIVIVSSDGADPLCRLDEMSNGADGVHPGAGFPFPKPELVPQNTVELRKNESRDEKIHLPSPDAMKNLVRLAPGKRESGNQNVGV